MNSKFRLSWEELVVYLIAATVFGIEVIEKLGVFDIEPVYEFIAKRYPLLLLLLFCPLVILAGHLRREIHDLKIRVEEYLPDRLRVVNALKNLVRSADEFALVVGSKSAEKDYLQLITGRLNSDSHFVYKRLLTGNHITPELFAHLADVLQNENVEVAWVRSEKYANITVSEESAIIALPSPDSNNFSGLRLIGREVSGPYARYVEVAFSHGIPIKHKRELQLLLDNEKGQLPIDELENKLKELHTQ